MFDLSAPLGTSAEGAELGEGLLQCRQAFDLDLGPDDGLLGAGFSGPALEALRGLLDEARLEDEAYLEGLMEKSGLSAREFREFLASLKGE